MSMDLWYELAVQELANLDVHVAKLIEDERAAEASAQVEAEAVPVVAVDFF
jgi:hypothetical protein